MAVPGAKGSGGTPLDLAAGVGAGLGLLMLVAVPLGGAFGWNWADDFCFRPLIAERGPLAFAAARWVAWDGRFLAYLLMGVLYALLPAGLIGAAWALTFAASAPLVALTLLSGRRFTPAVLAGASGVVAAALWLGLRRYLSEVAYWGAGGMYSAMLLGALAWCLMIRAVARRHLGWPGLLGVVLASVIASALSHHVAPALFAFGAVVLVQDWRKPGRRAVALALAGVLIGLTTLIAGSGPAQRLAQYGGHHGLDAGRLPAIAYDMVGGWLVHALPLLALAILLGLLAATLPVRPGSRSWRADALAWALGGLASSAPFFLLPEAAARRTSLIFAVFLAIALALVARAAGDRMVRRSPRLTPARLRPIAAALGLVLLVAGLGAVALHVRAARAIDRLMAAREAVIREARDRGLGLVEVPAIPATAIPASLAFADLSPDPALWINACAARFYGIDAIRATPSPG